MKLTQKQKQVVNEVYQEVEMGTPITVFKKEICSAFPDHKEEFQLLCKLTSKFEKLFTEDYVDLDS